MWPKCAFSRLGSASFLVVLTSPLQAGWYTACVVTAPGRLLGEPRHARGPVLPELPSGMAAPGFDLVLGGETSQALGAWRASSPRAHLAPQTRCSVQGVNRDTHQHHPQAHSPRRRCFWKKLPVPIMSSSLWGCGWVGLWFSLRLFTVKSPRTLSCVSAFQSPARSAVRSRARLLPSLGSPPLGQLWGLSVGCPRGWG